MSRPGEKRENVRPGKPSGTAFPGATTRCRRLTEPIRNPSRLRSSYCWADKLEPFARDRVKPGPPIARCAMNDQPSLLRRLPHCLRDEQGATAVEYAVMLAMILLSVLAAIGTVGAQTGGMWNGIVSGLKAVGFIP